MTNDIHVLSVQDRDLRPILGHFGLDVSIDEHRSHCATCSRFITWENLGAIRVKGDTLILYCDLSECLDAASGGGE